MLEFPGKEWKDYELLDSGRGEKLERFGPVVMCRPEPKALWDKSMTDAEWRKAAHFAFRLASADGKNGASGQRTNGGRDAGKGARNVGSGAIEDRGTWERLKKADDQWFIRYGGASERVPAGPVTAGDGSAAGPNFRLRLGLTAFKHVGVFPEQAPNWEFIYQQVKRLRGQNSAKNAGPESVPRVLNLFAYTGGASLAAKAAGADVTHLDSVRQVVTWARGNMEASGLDGIRWIVEDAMKFVQREARRGNLYDGIILDPPAYGHGPDGEKWKLDESLFGLLQNVSKILKPKDSFMVLNLYSNGYSAALGETLVREAFALESAGSRHSLSGLVRGGSKTDLSAAGAETDYRLTSGELALNDKYGKVLPLSIYVRLER